MAASESMSDEYYMGVVRQFMQHLLEQGNTGAIDSIFRNKIRNPPASKDFVANLTTIENTNNKKCPICLVKTDSVNDIIKELPKCGHFFHAECIVPWLERTNTCPMCRYEYPTDDVEYEEERRLKEAEVSREERLEELHNSMFG